MNTSEIEVLIKSGLPESEVTVTGGEGKYEADITSAAFAGLTTVKKHQLVYRIVNEHIVSGVIHALTLKCKTPTA